jgi:hypothetical protein
MVTATGHFASAASCGGLQGLATTRLPRGAERMPGSDEGCAEGLKATYRLDGGEGKEGGEAQARRANIFS